MAGDTIRMAPATTMMIHSAWGIAAGNQEDLREFTELLNLLDNEIAAVYSARTGKPVAEILDLMKAETWMNAAQAVEMGFADVAVADEKKKAKAAAPAVVFAALGKGPASGSVFLSAKLPGASGKTPSTIPKEANMKTREQITSFENKRAASAERKLAIMAAAHGEGRTLNETEETEYDGLESEIQAIDKHLVRLKALEQSEIQAATHVPAAPANAQDAATEAPARSGIISVKANVAPGVGFARMAIAMAATGGNRQAAAAFYASKRNWMDQTPSGHKILNAAIPAADTTTSGWASEIAYPDNLPGEFIEYLRPRTILGQMTTLRRVPFNVRMGSLTGGTSGYWVGQGSPIPVSKGTTGSLSLGITKAAGIAAFDKELMRLSSPSVEILVRDDLAKAVIQVVDDSFINPNNGGVANITPASVLYGVTPVTPTGVTAAALQVDIASLFAAAIAANLDTAGATLVMSRTTALKLSLMLTANGTYQFPGMTINGGVLNGIPVVVSDNTVITGSPQFGQMIVLVFPSEILLADDGGVEIDISDQTALQMLDNPTNTSTGSTTATTMVSMYQTESVAVKAVRYINWVKRRSAAAAFIQAANYSG